MQTYLLHSPAKTLCRFKGLSRLQNISLWTVLHPVENYPAIPLATASPRKAKKPIESVIMVTKTLLATAGS